jgi:DNA-binding ferritin-like protein
MKTRKIAKNGTTNRLTESLNQVLADSYALMALTHLAHWNRPDGKVKAVLRKVQPAEHLDLVLQALG